MIRKLSLLLAAVCTCIVAKAQYCGFDQVHRKLLSTSSTYASKVQAMDNDLAAILSGNPSGLIINTPNGPVYEIPVVIHVMHTGGVVGSTYNPSDAQLQGMITYLNQAYQATYASYPNTSNGGTYFPVQFALAKRDANCNSTSTGIDRVNAASLLNSIYGSTAAVGTRYANSGVKLSTNKGIGEDTLKALANWNHNDYYNIWVVNKIDSVDGGPGSGTFTAGYAYYPGAPYTIDGTIMLATQATAGQITLVHEIGHAFSLYHTFEGDDPGGTGAATTCPTNSNCLTDGDKVCDTDPHKRTMFGPCPSPTSTNACTGNPIGYLPHNFMDYSLCQDRFTPGQKTRFMNALSTSRASLLSSLGATATGTSPAAATCQPTMPFPFAAIYDAGVYETKITDASGNFNMTASSDGGYNSDGDLEYIDRSCFQRANLVAGSSYTLSVKTGPNREYVRVYIDYNNDGVFNTTTELVYSHNGSSGSAGSYETHTTTYTVPTTGVTLCTPLRMRVITDVNNGSIPAPTPCSALTYGQAEDYSVVVRGAATSTITVSQTTGSNPSCSGSTIGFTANYTGSPTSPSVKMYVNGVQVSTTNTYSSSTLANGDQVTAKLFFTGICGADSITSAPFTVSRSATVTPTVSIAVTSGSNPGCAGQPITFTATPTNGGSAPTYQWYIGTTPVSGATSSSYSTSTLPCNSAVKVVMTSNSPCASTTTATSNTINYTCGTQAVSVAIAVTGGSNPTCSGRNVTFTATPTNGGSAPAYQWYINGSIVTGATGSSFTTNVLNNGDSVYVVLTSNYSCAANTVAQSPAITMSVIPTVTPTVTKAITTGTNPGCIGDPVTFTATPSNAGGNPSYRWFYNGTPVTLATNPTFTLPTGGATGDVVWVRIIASASPTSCYTRDTAYSDTTTMDRRQRPNLPIISFIGHQLVSDSANVQWWGPAGLIPGATGTTYTPPVQGDYYAVIINPLCGTGKSNVLTVSPLTIGNYNMNGVQLFPNPTTGILTITWSTASTTRITVFTAAGKSILHDVATLSTRRQIDLSSLSSGVYFVQLQDESGKTGVVRVTLSH